MDVAIRNAIKELVLKKSGRIWSGPAKGMHIDGPNSARVFLGLYEIELNRWIRQFLGSKPNVFDIGAQYGFDALMFAGLGARKVLTVELDPEMRPVIEANIKRNNLVDRVSLEIAKVGDGRNSSTLDELGERHFWPQFVKMDIEGGEASALLGGSKTLDRCDQWLIETHGLEVENACIRILEDHGFKVDKVAPRKWLPDRRPIEHNAWVIAQR